ncbi:hypothetical protein [Ornithinimicrobium faecis]|uniref:Uncharacterized protein n=1 Tax=Ornithinimicrobium faecis TaxID=2934158 RepID=A0ABY4YS88_9MICO|nr:MULTISPECIES: hypothetical protein [unclassified Ornithinimicrobium]USQ79627.1 hypothetical protein NF556_18865 [Ornithinimicrobium sp. HY1793]
MAQKRSSSGKKVVRAEKAPASRTSESKGTEHAPDVESTWTATPEARKKAGTFRLLAGLLWALAIAGELVGIFWVLRQSDINMVLLIGLIVVIGALAIGGSLLWKKANRLDPAERKDTVRFFVQNQLGAIITIIAFLPLIVMILLNDDLDKKDKAIAGTVGVVVAVIATLVSVDWDPPSVEQYTAESSTVIDITGEDLVYWTSSGEVFHLCQDASAVNLESKDNTIYSGTVADAHAAGKSRLTKQVAMETKQCGFEVDESEPQDTDSADLSEAPAP